MTCAVAEAIMNGGERDDFIDAMKKYGRMYPDAGYGGIKVKEHRLFATREDAEASLPKKETKQSYWS